MEKITFKDATEQQAFYLGACQIAGGLAAKSEKINADDAVEFARRIYQKIKDASTIIAK